MRAIAVSIVLAAIYLDGHGVGDPGKGWTAAVCFLSALDGILLASGL